MRSYDLLYKRNSRTFKHLDQKVAVFQGFQGLEKPVMNFKYFQALKGPVRTPFKCLTSIGWLFFRESSSRARLKSLEANCVQMSYSGKQWSTQRYSIQDAKPSFSHKCVHHSCQTSDNLHLFNLNEYRMYNF